MATLSWEFAFVAYDRWETTSSIARRGIEKLEASSIILRSKRTLKVYFNSKTLRYRQIPFSSRLPDCIIICAKT